jgi:nicotinamidase-related amidase
MVQRTPFGNIMRPGPHPRLSAGTAALLILDFQRFFTERTLGIGDVAHERGIDVELDEYYEQVGYARRNIRDLVDAFAAAGAAVIATALVDRGAGTTRASQLGWLPSPGSIESRLDECVPEGIDRIERRAFDPFLDTDLASRLAGRDTLVVCGLTANGAVYQTALGAADRGFNVVVVSDASPGDTFEIHDFFMTQLTGGLVHVRTTGAVLGMLEGRRS